MIIVIGPHIAIGLHSVPTPHALTPHPLTFTDATAPPPHTPTIPTPTSPLLSILTAHAAAPDHQPTVPPHQEDTLTLMVSCMEYGTQDCASGGYTSFFAMLIIMASCCVS